MRVTKLRKMSFLHLPLELISEIILNLPHPLDLKNICLAHGLFRQMCQSSREIQMRVRESKIAQLSTFRFWLDYSVLFSAMDYFVNRIMNDVSREEIETRLNFVVAQPELEACYEINVDLASMSEKWQQFELDSNFFQHASTIFEDALTKNNIILQISMLILLERVIAEFDVCYFGTAAIRKMLRNKL